jgi:hypothetical protein
LNVHGINEVRQTEIYTTEPLVPELSAFEVEMAVEEPKRHKSPGIDQIPAELIKARCRTVCTEISQTYQSIWNKRICLRSGRSQLLYLCIRRVIKQIVLIKGAYQFC